MKIVISQAGYNETFEREWEGEDHYKAEDQLSLIADYLFQYKVELLNKLKTELHPIKKEIIQEKIKSVENILVDNKDMFTFLHLAARAL